MIEREEKIKREKENERERERREKVRARERSPRRERESTGREYVPGDTGLRVRREGRRRGGSRCINSHKREVRDPHSS